MIRIFALTGIIIVVFCGCNQNKFVPTFKITDPDVIKASTFYENSYFVFRDSVTGIEDSFNCPYPTSIYDHVFLDWNDKPIKYQEEMTSEFSMKVPPDSSSFYDFATADIAFSTIPDSMFMSIRNYKPIISCKKYTVYLGESNTNLQKLDSLIINGKVYKNVFISKDKYNYCYFNRDVGLLKISGTDSNGTPTTTKEIIRYSSLK